jgi:hypothetical protein
VNAKPVLILGLGFLLAGCGKVGDPLPPFIQVPLAVEDLAAVQSGYNIVLAWTNPSFNIDGSAAMNLAHVQIRRDDVPVATVNVSAPGKPQSHAIPIDRIAGAARTFTVFVDTAKGRVSNVSNAVTITPVQVPGEVTGLRAVVDQRRIVLEWDRPQEYPELADAYIVARTDVPAESQTLEGLRFEDTRYEPGKTFTYQVTPVRRLDGRVIAGVGSDTFMIVVDDKTPPQVPAGLDITRSDTGVILTWNANPETDLAGYRVFRSDPADGNFTPVGAQLIVTNMFTDLAYRPGLYYAVSAVDEFENESGMSAPFRGP